MVIMPTHSHKFLEVKVDNRLCWKDHINHAISKGMAYTLQLRRLSHSTKGILLPLTWKLYSAVALPKTLYTINVWYQPLYQHNRDKLTRGSIQMTKKLGMVQHVALVTFSSPLAPQSSHHSLGPPSLIILSPPSSSPSYSSPTLLNTILP